MKAAARTLMLLFALLAPMAGWSADIHLQRTTDGSAILNISGEIALGDDKKFNNLAIQFDKATVFLESPGGLAVVGMEIGKTIHIKGFPTVVMPDAICASTCALIWLAGQPRGVFKNSKLGFHAVYTVDSGEASVSSAGNALVGAYLQKLGLNERIIFFVTNSKPSDFEWLDADEAQKLGLEVLTLPDVPSSPTSFAERPKSNQNSSATVTTSESGKVGTDGSEHSRSVTRNWTALANSDLSGYDLPGMPLSLGTPLECRLACEAEARCVAFTLNAPHRACFLKSHAFEALQYSGAISEYDAARVVVTKIGRDVGSLTFRTSDGLEILASPYLSFRGATLAWCQDKCVSQKRCAAFNFYRGGECRLLRENKRSRRNAGAYSGMKLN